MSSSINEGSSDRGQFSSSPPRDKKRSLGLEDDFFSLSSSLDKKKKKKSKHKSSSHHHHHNHNHNQNQHSSDVSDDKIIVADTEVVEREASDDIIELTTTTKASTAGVEPLKKISAIVDRDAIRSRLQKTLKHRESITPTQDEFLLEDETEERELEFFREERSFSPTIVENDDSYKFTKENEKYRQYIIKVLVKLDVPTSFNALESTDFGTTGVKGFEKIQKSILKYFREKFIASGYTLEQASQYEFDKTSLIWIDGKMEMKPFFKPSTLRIKPNIDILTNAIPPTVINCILIPKENLNKLAMYFGSKEIFELEDDGDEIFEDAVEELNDVGYSSISEGEDDCFDGPLVETIDLEEEGEKDEFFTIGLKGKDNKRISIKVSPKTQIRKLLLHYLKIKNIKETSINMSKAKLIFDDEEMNLNEVVGDTELEEDYEVQVVI